MQLRAAAPSRAGPGVARAEQCGLSRGRHCPAQWRAALRCTRPEGHVRLQCELACGNAAVPPVQRMQGSESGLGARAVHRRGRAAQRGALGGAESAEGAERSTHSEGAQLFHEEGARSSTDGGRGLSPWAYAEDLPTQAESVSKGVATVEAPATKVLPDIDYLQELLAIQQQGPRNIGFFGTRNMGFLHQQLIEILSYAMVITNNHIYTSGAAGTNAAVIRGALRAERPDLLTVILPQSLGKQPPESQELLLKVQNVIEMPHNDHLPLIEASRLCNMDILSHVQQVICFAFHDSRLLMETCQEAKNLRKIVTLFYLD